MIYRRFGKTELQIPVFSCGGMRYQQSWQDEKDINPDNQKNLEACIRRAVEVGINHIETARGYGSSEYQLGKILPQLPRQEIIVQTKVGPEKDIAKFKANFEKSMGYLNVDYLDLFAFHGINTPEHFENFKTCLDTARTWQKEGRIRFIGFATHGPTDIILQAINTGEFDYVNLHYYYVFQRNWTAIKEASRRDMGVFIISPNDKGGMLYKPTPAFSECTAPLHPMTFNALFCLQNPEIHTLSTGVARPEDFDIHLETVGHVHQAKALIEPLLENLRQRLIQAHGQDWIDAWDNNLPDIEDTPGNINIYEILRLYNFAAALDMTEYGQYRYNMLGKNDGWFFGETAAKVGEVDLTDALSDAPQASRIPQALAQAHALLAGEAKKRLQEA